MKVTVYELLGMVKNAEDRSLYVKYFDRVNKKEDKMWACKENIIYKLDQLNISLNDEVEIIDDEPRDIEVCGTMFTRSKYNKLAGIEEDKKIEKLDVALLGQCDNWLQPTIETNEKIRAELNPYVIDNIRENTLEFQRKINEIIDKINRMEK